MSAALQLPLVWGAAVTQPKWPDIRRKEQEKLEARQRARPASGKLAAEPVVSVAFYRKHTESMLRRYLYASMQVGRAPAILGDPVGRGWVFKPSHSDL